MSIDSTSTLHEVKAAYYDNADYDLSGGSLAKAEAFIGACRQLLIRLSKKVAHGNRTEEIELDPGVIERQIADCKRWIFAAGNRSSAPPVRVFSRGDYFQPTYPGPYYG